MKKFKEWLKSLGLITRFVLCYTPLILAVVLYIIYFSTSSIFALILGLIFSILAIFLLIIESKIRSELRNQANKEIAKQRVEYTKIIHDSEISLFTEIVGVHFESRQRYLSLCEEDDELVVIPDHTKDYPNGYAVEHIRLNKRLGYLPEDVAEELTEKYGRNTKFNATVFSITKESDNPNSDYECEIEITDVRDEEEDLW